MMIKMGMGFKMEFTEKVYEIIKKLSPSTIFEVKHVRKMMGIEPNNRSQIIFISIALKQLETQGKLEHIDLSRNLKYRRVI